MKNGSKVVSGCAWTKWPMSLDPRREAMHGDRSQSDRYPLVQRDRPHLRAETGSTDRPLTRTGRRRLSRVLVTAPFRSLRVQKTEAKAVPLRRADPSEVVLTRFQCGQAGFLMRPGRVLRRSKNCFERAMVQQAFVLFTS
jgi:hypothetical protein